MNLEVNTMLIHAKIQKWGNSLALRLTGPIKSIPKFEAGMQVDVEVSERGIRVKPVERQRIELPYTESELLKGITPKKAHADEIAVVALKELGE